MEPLPPLTPEEYAALKEFLAKMDETEARLLRKGGRRFRDSDLLRDVDEWRVVLRAYVEGYEAANR